MNEELEKRQDELLAEFDKTIEEGVRFSGMPPYGLYMSMFINFLIRKIMKFENSKEKGGETNGNSEKE